jgi:hypothetical protein
MNLERNVLLITLAFLLIFVSNVGAIPMDCNPSVNNDTAFSVLSEQVNSTDAGILQAALTANFITSFYSPAFEPAAMLFFGAGLVVIGSFRNRFIKK